MYQGLALAMTTRKVLDMTLQRLLRLEDRQQLQCLMGAVLVTMDHIKQHLHLHGDNLFLPMDLYRRHHLGMSHHPMTQQ
jgi:hypothetical protein